MDNVTHTLFALALARTRLGRMGRGATAALVLASSAPDVDIVASAAGAASYLKWHRGPTHGPLGVIGLGVLVAALTWAGRTWWDRRAGVRHDNRAPDASFVALAGLSMVATALHILMDLPTSYGTRLLSPFDWHWYALDWIPIVDVYLLTALVIGIILGRGSESARRRGAVIILVFMTANYGIRAAGHRQALEMAPRLFGPTLPNPCPSQAGPTPIAMWPRDVSVSNTGCLMEIAALPTFASPFRWRLIAQLSNAYEIHEVDLLDRGQTEPADRRDAFYRLSLRYPNQWGPPVFEAARTALGQVFLGFSRFPAARSTVESDGLATVRWTDMRFVGGVLRLDQPAGQATAFTAVIRIAPGGEVLLQQFGPRR